MSYATDQFNNELYHHGVKGMKWGVRRYQNKDGSYTKRGVERFKEAESRYDSAKKDFNSAKKLGNKAEIKSTRKAVQNEKAQMNKAYKQLKKDNRADQGKDLYAQGKTITGNNFKNRYGQVGITIGTTIANKAVSSILDNRKAVLITKKYGAIPMSKISQTAIATGGAVANAILQIKTLSDNRKLRAYYGHSGNRGN